MDDRIKSHLAVIQRKCLVQDADDQYIPLAAGKLIFLAHYSPELLPYDVLEQVVEASTHDATQSLCAGSLAVALLIRDLCALELLDASELADLDASADSIYQRALADHAQKREYDLFTGLIGKGVYFLAAQKWALVAEVVRYLDACKVEVGDTCYWLDHMQGTNRCDLGLAHGLPSIIAFLADCFRHGIEPERCRQLLERVVPYLLSQRGKAAAPYQFPLTLNVATGEATSTSRLAWCYGDMGVAVALWRAGAALAHQPWCEAALAIMHNAGQISRAQAGVFRSAQHQALDTGFCHGTAGIAHLFHRFYQATGQPEFRAYAEDWLDFTLQQLESGTFLFPVDMTRDVWVEHAGLLEGYAGIGMVLLSFLEPARYGTWDRSFLTAIA